MIKSTVVAKLLTVKAAAIAVTAVSLGGVAVAATTGVLSNPLAAENSNNSAPATTHSKQPDATPSPSLVGLCTAYLAGAGAEHGKALENPAFTVLINAAGGKDNVATYCASLGVTEPGSGRGKGGPTDHPTGKPDDVGATPTHPVGQPSVPPSHPSGPPNGQPTPPKS